MGIMVRSNTRDISINNIGINSSVNRTSNSSYAYRSNSYNSSTSSYSNNLSDGEGEMTANSTYSQQTLLERRLGSFTELNASESNSISSSNGIRPRKLKISKGKDRIIPVQYVRRHSSNSDCNVTPEVLIEKHSSNSAENQKTSSLENVDSLNIMKFLPKIQEASRR